MNGYLKTLAERSLAAAPLIRPRHVSIFEPPSQAPGQGIQLAPPDSTEQTEFFVKHRETTDMVNAFPPSHRTETRTHQETGFAPEDEKSFEGIASPGREANISQSSMPRISTHPSAPSHEQANKVTELPKNIAVPTAATKDLPVSPMTPPPVGENSLVKSPPLERAPVMNWGDTRREATQEEELQLEKPRASNRRRLEDVESQDVPRSQSKKVSVEPSPLKAQPFTVQRPELASSFSNEGSTIRISIGRIDVRAILPPAPPAPLSHEPKASPRLSLEEYLKQRNGARL